MIYLAMIFTYVGSVPGMAANLSPRFSIVHILSSGTSRVNNSNIKSKSSANLFEQK